MISKPCVVDYWRNYVPACPALTLSAPNNKEFIYDLGDLILQGARNYETNVSPTEGILDKVPVQRGWRCRAIIISQPLHGQVSLSEDGTQLKYIPMPAYVGQDCFAYAITNGTQQSIVSNITINCLRGYDYSLMVYRRNTEQTLHRMVLAPAFDFASMGLPKVHLLETSWFYNQYAAETIGKVTRISKKRVHIGGTILNTSLYDQVRTFAPTLINNGLIVTPTTYFEDSLPAGLRDDSAAIFKPKHLAGNIEIELKLYTKTKLTPIPTNPSQTLLQVDMSEFITANIAVVDRYGIRWPESGNIQI